MYIPQSTLEMAGEVYKEWIAYSLGLIETKPGLFPDELLRRIPFLPTVLKLMRHMIQKRNTKPFKQKCN